VALPDAYAACQRLAATHYENFPVASRLLPAAMRPHVAAVYAFARVADDFADEDGLDPSVRFERLDDWHARLRAAAGVGPPVTSPAPAVPDIDPALVFEALAASMRACRLPLACFEDLLSAFRQDVAVRRYATWDAVLDYCRRSANPVGRLVLRIAGHDDPSLDRASDALCSALQLTNFWQDLAVDWRRGRLYVPEAERDAASAREHDLDTGRITAEWRAALGRAAVVTRRLFDEGRPVCDGVGGRLRYELRATWLGATRVLDRLEAVGFDVFRARPALGAGDAAAIAIGVATWRRASRPSGGTPVVCSRDAPSPGPDA
jgi:squalene synthase HpnC